MDSAILVRLPNGRVVAIMDYEGYYIATWPDLTEAAANAEAHPLCQQNPYQIVELDEL